MLVHVQMVGRLVEDQKICVGEHELCERQPPALPAGEIRHALVDIVPREEKCREHVPDLGVVHVGPGVLELLEERELRVQDLVFLIVVGDENARAEA